MTRRGKNPQKEQGFSDLLRRFRRTPLERCSRPS